MKKKKNNNYYFIIKSEAFSTTSRTNNDPIFNTNQLMKKYNFLISIILLTQCDKSFNFSEYILYNMVNTEKTGASYCCLYLSFYLLIFKLKYIFIIIAY